MIRKFKRLSAYKKKKILKLQAEGVKPKDIQRKLKISKSTYYYFVNPNSAAKAIAHARAQRAQPTYKRPKKWDEHKKLYQNWYRKAHRKQVRVWDRRYKSKVNKIKKLKKLELKKVELIEIAKRLGLYETH